MICCQHRFTTPPCSDISWYCIIWEIPCCSRAEWGSGRQIMHELFGKKKNYKKNYRRRGEKITRRSITEKSISLDFSCFLFFLPSKCLGALSWRLKVQFKHIGLNSDPVKNYVCFFFLIYFIPDSVSALVLVNTEGSFDPLTWYYQGIVSIPSLWKVVERRAWKPITSGSLS